jgi:hypothetical protein
MQLVDADEIRDPVFKTEWVVTFSDPIDVEEIAFRKTNVVFPEPGEYRLQLFGKGQFLRERRLAVEWLDAELYPQ